MFCTVHRKLNPFRFAGAMLLAALSIATSHVEAGTTFIARFDNLETVVDTPAITNEFGFYSAFGGPRDARRDMNQGILVDEGNTLADPHFVQRVGGPNGRALQMAAGGWARALPGTESELALWAEANSYVRLSNFTVRAGGLGHTVHIDLTTNALGLLEAIAEANPEEVDAANAKFHYTVKNHTTGDVILSRETTLFANEGQGPHLDFDDSRTFSIDLPREKRYDIETYGYVYSQGLSLANDPPIPPDDAAKIIDPFHDRARQPFPDPKMGLPQPLPVFGTAEGFGGSRPGYVGAVRGDDDAAIDGLTTLYIDETLISPNRPFDWSFSVEVPEEGSSLMAVDNLFNMAPGFHADSLHVQIGSGVGDDFTLTDNPRLLGMSNADEPPNVRPELFYDVQSIDEGHGDTQFALNYLLNVSDEIDGVLDGFATFTLRHIVAGIAGDYNGDGLTNELDYHRFASTYGSTEDLAADGDANGVIGASDYALWRESLHANLFGVGPNNAAGLATAAPAPSSLCLALLTGISALRIRRRVASGPRAGNRAVVVDGGRAGSQR